jgi:hypothetical protein
MSKHADRRDSAEVVSMPTIGVFAKLTEWMTTNDRNGLVSSPSNIVRRTAAYGAVEAKFASARSSHRQASWTTDSGGKAAV